MTSPVARHSFLPVSSVPGGSQSFLPKLQVRRQSAPNPFELNSAQQLDAAQRRERFYIKPERKAVNEQLEQLSRLNSLMGVGLPPLNKKKKPDPLARRAQTDSAKQMQWYRKSAKDLGGYNTEKLARAFDAILFELEAEIADAVSMECHQLTAEEFEQCKQKVRADQHREKRIAAIEKLAQFVTMDRSGIL